MKIRPNQYNHSMLNKMCRISLCVNMYVMRVHGLRASSFREDGTEKIFSVFTAMTSLFRRKPAIEAREIITKTAMLI